MTWKWKLREFKKQSMQQRKNIWKFSHHHLLILAFAHININKITFFCCCYIWVSWTNVRSRVDPMITIFGATEPIVSPQWHESILWCNPADPKLVKKFFPRLYLDILGANIPFLVSLLIRLFKAYFQRQVKQPSM